MGSRPFLLLASPERAPLFDEVLGGVDCIRVSTVLDAVKQVVSDPPAAVLMDLASTLHAGVSETAPLYDLGVDLPILRCTGGAGAPWIGMCQAPFKRMPLREAIAEIDADDPSWKHPVNLRRYVRVNQNARVLHRKIGNLRNRMHRQAMRITVLKDRSENIKMHYDAVTRMKIIWYPYQFLRKLFPAKDVKAWMTQREADKKLAYFRQIIEQPEEEDE